MDLKLFFEPVHSAIFDPSLGPISFQNTAYNYKGNELILDGIKIAILWIREGRGSNTGQDISEVPNLVRKQLYPLIMDLKHNGILDLGDLINGPTINDTKDRLKEVCAYLTAMGVLPIILGGFQDMTVSQYLSYERSEKLVTLLNIDAKLDLEESGNAVDSYLGVIFKHDPNYLFNYIHLGYQTYFLKETKLGMLESLGFDAYRIGEFKDRIKETEPLIREADLISFDLSAIQSLYCPDTLVPNVFGFSGEEACQLAWYAGLNDKLSSIGFYNMTCNLEHDTRTPMVVAVMIWYFIDGFFHRKGELNYMSNDYLIYEVTMNDIEEGLRFFKSKLSGKWWIELVNPKVNSGFFRSKMIPCSYTDYQTALSGEIPERWIKAQGK